MVLNDKIKNRINGLIDSSASLGITDNDSLTEANYIEKAQCEAWVTAA